MPSEDMTEIYNETARHAYEKCMEIMAQSMAAYEGNTSEFISANVYVAGGMLAACQMFAKTRAEKEQMKVLMLTAVDNILEQNIEQYSPPEGLGN